MPYRRLPKTNQARLKALNDVLRTGTKYDEEYNLAFPYTLLDQVRQIVPQYERKMKEYNASFATQTLNSRNCSNEAKMARMYVSHFMQVLNMCIQRGEIKPDVKTLFGQDPEDLTVPDISTDEKLAVWGRKIIDGEQTRKNQGGLPIYNPTITKVAVYFDQFMDKYSGIKLFQRNTARTSQSIAEMNDQVDKLLLEIWNAVEAKFADLPEPERLMHCREYGVVYYYRKGEKNKEILSA